MILIPGGDGQLGQCLNDHLKNAAYLSIEDCDITKPVEIRSAIEKYKPTSIINCAAYTHVDKCESEQELAMAVNKEGARNLAEAANEFNLPLIHISTDYIFDGTKNTPYKEDDLTNPNSIYGESKLLGEKEIIEHCRNFLIIRTSWLYSEYASNFVKNIANLMNQRDSLGIVYDQVGSPTYAQDLAMAINQITETTSNYKNQIYHFSNTGVTSWYDLTLEIKNTLDIQCDISPIESHEYPTPVKRPHYSVFNTKKIRDTFDIHIPHWKESLEICLRKL